ncbi:MAG: TIGR00366 family protein, partial [Burkholderia sp.]|uniref:TIGR00366 family protein n=1 Tax=Burkholderia sp. TaxID=36773 RepID=UPI00258B26EF
MIQRISRFFTQVVHRVLPDPLIFAILLTIVTFALAFGLTPNSPAQLTTMCGSG